MSLTQFTTDVANIAALSDTPNVTDGLTSSQLKAKFDQAGTDIKTYINDTLLGEIESLVDSYAADAGSTDAYAVTLSPVPTAYAAGMVVRFKANTANTGAATLNVNSLGAKTIKKFASTDLETGDIVANQIVTVIYDGTNFQMLSMPSNYVKDTGDEMSGNLTLPAVIGNNSGGTILILQPSSAGGDVKIQNNANLSIQGNTISVGSSLVKIVVGSGTPESSVTAPVGSLYLRTNGGAGTTLYVKESGTGNTGWVSK